MEFPIRINKYLAERGIASRREADVLIAAGKVLVNGQQATVGQKVSADDSVTVVGKQPRKTYLAYYKPRGIITHSPAPHEEDIAHKLESDYGLINLSPIGRLDKDSEGLILISDDGRLTGPLLDPAAQHEKEYVVTVDKPITNWFLRHMAAGVTIEGYTTKPAQIEKHPTKPDRFSLILTEGKKHQIRRMCAALGYQVRSLKRVRIMHIELGKLKPNQFRKLTPTERSALFSKLSLS